MKRWVGWIFCGIILMIGCPWLAVRFAGSSGMAVCFLLFFAINPMFCLFCGLYAGKHIRALWMLPLFQALLYLAGAWMFFEMGEPAFLQYFLCYLLIGNGAMLIRHILNK